MKNAFASRASNAHAVCATFCSALRQRYAFCRKKAYHFNALAKKSDKKRKNYFWFRLLFGENWNLSAHADTCSPRIPNPKWRTARLQFTIKSNIKNWSILVSAIPMVPIFNNPNQSQMLSISVFITPFPNEDYDWLIIIIISLLWRLDFSPSGRLRKKSTI